MDDPSPRPPQPTAQRERDTRRGEPRAGWGCGRQVEMFPTSSLTNRLLVTPTFATGRRAGSVVLSLRMPKAIDARQAPLIVNLEGYRQRMCGGFSFA